MSSEIAVAPYRGELEALRAENEALRARLDAIDNDRTLVTAGDAEMPPYTSIFDGCRKCGNAKDIKDNFYISERYEPATPRTLWSFLLLAFVGRRPHPERIRKSCRWCKAVYYERTKDNSTDVTAVSLPTPP